MTTTPELIRVQHTAWDDALAGIPRDIYHTAGYHRFAQGSNEGEPYLFVVGDERRGFAWPYLLRAVDDIPGLQGAPAADVNSVYGYPGPLAWGCGPGDPFIAAAWRALVDTWRQQGAVSAFTRFHPLLGNERLLAGLEAPPATDGAGGTVAGGDTVAVDLSQGFEHAGAAYARELRRDLRAGRRAGLVTHHDEAGHDLPAFARLYRTTMLRKRAHDFYLFREEDFVRLRDAVAGRLHLLVTRVGEEIGAAGLFFEFEGIVQWHLVGTSEEHRRLSPSKVLLDDAIRWAAERGNRVVHLGGGRGGRNDSLLWFKGRFSPDRHAFHTGRWVLDQRTYRELVRGRDSALPKGARTDPGYFPRYRAPVILGVEPPAHHRTAAPLEVRRIDPADAEALADLLPRIDSTYFHPHPMTAAEAVRISRRTGRDVYLLGRVDGRPVAYGMLRGWDEGFRIPSLGIGVDRALERRGYGRAMMIALHEIARERNTKQVRLRVHPDNTGAAALYRSLGYAEVGVERSEILMLLDL